MPDDREGSFSTAGARISSPALTISTPRSFTTSWDASSGQNLSGRKMRVNPCMWTVLTAYSTISISASMPSAEMLGTCVAS
jgi:hypothetical protein